MKGNINSKNLTGNSRGLLLVKKKKTEWKKYTEIKFKIKRKKTTNYNQNTHYDKK